MMYFVMFSAWFSSQIQLHRALKAFESFVLGMLKWPLRLAALGGGVRWCWPCRWGLDHWNSVHFKVEGHAEPGTCRYASRFIPCFQIHVIQGEHQILWRLPWPGVKNSPQETMFSWYGRGSIEEKEASRIMLEENITVIYSRSIAEGDMEPSLLRDMLHVTAVWSLFPRDMQHTRPAGSCMLPLSDPSCGNGGLLDNDAWCCLMVEVSDDWWPYGLSTTNQT